MPRGSAARGTRHVGHDRSHEVLARARRRADPVRRVPARLQAARGPAGRVLRARPRGRPGRAHDLRPVERLLRRPDREEAAQPLPARARRCCRSAPPAATSRAASARTGTSRSRRRSTPSPTQASPDAHRRGGRASSAAAASRSPTTTPSIFLEYAIDVADACHERGINAVAVTAGYICAEPRARVLRRTWTPPTSTSRRSPRTSTATSAAATSARCSTRSSTSTHETDVWFEITTLLIPGRNDSDDGARRDDDAGSSSTSGPTCRCTSPRSIPTSRCWTSRRTPPATLDPRPRDRAAQRRALRLHRQRPRPGRRLARSAPAAARSSSSATGTSSRACRLTDDGRCTRAGLRCPAVRRPRRRRGARGACRCASRSRAR